MGVAHPSRAAPPPPDALDGERGRVVVDPDVDPAGVGGQVVDAIGRRPSQPGDREVVHAHLLRVPLGLPLPPAVLEVPDQFLLLGVDRDHRGTRRQGRLRRSVDVRELSVAVGVALLLACLAGALQTVARRVQRVGDPLIADLMSLRAQLGGQSAQALARPAQR